MAWTLKRKQSTGWRDISSLVPGLTGGIVHLGRTRETVTLRFSDVTIADPGATSATWNSFLPVGFRIDLPGFSYFPVATRSSAHSSGPMRIDQYGHITVYDARDKIMSFIISFPTTEPWPTSYPGVSA